MPDAGGVGPGGIGWVVAVPGYRELTEIGRGSSSIVYRAWQADFNRWVALKILTIDSSTTSLGQFRRERMAMGMLSSHPNIVTVYDGALLDAATAYIAMEYLPDGTLAHRLREGPIAWPQAVAIAIAMSGALESAHRAGVLHLDVKPENIFLSSEFDTVKLGDFGIARIRGDARTRTHMVSGTLLHMAPERLRDQEPTVASDVYSLASTLFALVSGHPPFGRPDEPDGVVLGRLLGDRPPVPDLRRQGLPDPVCQVIEQGLSPDPTARPPTAGQLGEQLRTAQAEAGLEPTPMSVGRASVSLPALALGESPVDATTLPPTPTPTPPDPPDDGDRDDAPAHRRRLDRRTLVALATVVVLVVAGSGAFALFERAPIRPSPPPDAQPTTTRPTSVGAEPSVAFEDDFSDPATGWARYAAEAHYHAGQYRMRLPGGPTRRVVNAPESVPILKELTGEGIHVRLEVDVTFVVPNTHGAAGLHCRTDPGTKDRYQGVISSNGRWAITKDGANDPIETLKSGTALVPPNGVYRLTLECLTDGPVTRLRLALAGVPLGEIIHSGGLRGGGVGVVTTTVRPPGVEALFDNFKATRA